jgi:hypothetical protein
VPAGAFLPSDVAGEVVVTAARTAPVQPKSHARRPSALVTVNGTPVPGVVSFEVANNNFFAADRFSLCLDLARQPAAMQEAWFSDTNDIEVSISTVLLVDGDTTSTPVEWIDGNVDHVDIDLEDRKARLTGRDFSAAFMEAKTTERFQNQTASQIATLLATRHGLSSQVTQTSTVVGTYYEIDHARLTREETEWDLLTYLAQNEGFDVFVRGKTLFFQPPADEGSKAWTLEYVAPTAATIASGTFTALKLGRALTLARDVIVKVQSWNSKTGTSFIKTIKAIGAGKSQQVGGKSQIYSFTRPGMDPQQAIQFGQQKLAEITKHERVINADVPADNVLTPQMRLDLRGTNTSFDQLYFVDEVVRRMSFEEGYRMTVRAKNHSPQSTVPA